MSNFRNIYIQNRFYLIVCSIALFFVLGVRWEICIRIGQIMLASAIGLTFFDVFTLVLPNKQISAFREVADKLSLGDENTVQVEIRNGSNFKYTIELVDELPYQFQERDFSMKFSVEAKGSVLAEYGVRPVLRGEYVFGNINLFLSTFLGLVSYRKVIETDQMTRVYPSVLQMKKHELIILSQNATLQGIKKIRKLGANNEFEQIKNYVQGDDYKSVNWKATSRRNELMVNQYQEEKSQNLYCVIDKSRNMQMPFNQLSLLDYAINSTLVMSNTAMLKGDRAGLMTFSDKLGTRLQSNNGAGQMSRILELLYRQKTGFKEANFELLYYGIRQQIKGRSLILLYTNFESVYALERALPVLRKINAMHLLVVVFFENSEIEKVNNLECKTVRDVYFKTLAQKFLMEKNLIVRELAKYGIQSILTKPEDLTVNSINKYLELKSRGMI